MLMQLTDVFLNLGEDQFSKLVRSISIGKLKTYQLYERFKLRTHVAKLNTENLRKATPKLWARLQERNDEFATDLSQAVLVSHLDMIIAVLNFLGVPHEEGFFAKDLDAAPYLTEGWRERTFEKFKGEFPEAVVLFYINHLALEMGKAEEAFVPAA
jgi:hypothetical protein